MSCVTVSEVAAILINANMPIEDFRGSILPLISIILPFNEEQALITAVLQKKTKEKGFSLGDRACLALGITKQLPIYTADRIWVELTLDNIDIRLIR